MEGLRCGRTALKLLILQLICICSAAASFSNDSSSLHSSKLGFRVDLTRRDHHLSFPHRFQAAVDRSNSRVGNMSSLLNEPSKHRVYQTPVHWGDGEFLMNVAVGTPGVRFEAIVDTGSDLIWAQCKPCSPCITQPTRLFDPMNSNTYHRIPCTESVCRMFDPRCRRSCSYTYSYADGSYTGGDLAYETLTIGRHTKVPRVVFGCGHQNTGTSHGHGGLVGLGRGPFSLLSQLGAKVGNKFSYCLLPITHPRSKSSPLFFGRAANFKGGQTLTLIKNHMNPSLWYIPMTGIDVACKAVPVSPTAFQLKGNGFRGGVIIDSGTTLSYFKKSIYRPLRRAIKKAVKLKPVSDPTPPLDLCYSRPTRWPSLTFHFEGGAKMQVPGRNYFIEASPGRWCLAFSPSDSFSILGNIVQQNFHILYDNARNKLSFKPEKCGSL